MGTRKLMTTGWMREEMMKVIELYCFKVCSFSKFVYTVKKEKGAKVYAGGES